MLTIGIELPVALYLLKAEHWRRVVLAIASVNLITHPIAWLAVTHGLPWLLTEVAVVLFEVFILAIIFRKQADRAVFTGICMNVVTAAIGYAFF